MFFNWATITALIGLGGWIIPFVMLFILNGWSLSSRCSEHLCLDVSTLAESQ